MLDNYRSSLELVYRDIVMQQAIGFDSNREQACELIRQVLVIIDEMEALQLTQQWHTAPRSVTNGVGRPRFQVPKEQLSLLMERRFTIPQIAELIGISTRTLHRRMSEYGLSIRSTYSELTEVELDDVILSIHEEFPMCGNKQMTGHLLSRGIRVQQSRVRDSMRRIDPEGTAARRLHAVNRRHYSVAAPRSLYHIDGNHKLIRLGLLT